MNSKFQAFHVQQHDQSDCGIACLLSVLRYYGGNTTLGQLRNWSGTAATGTTMLGLYQAAPKLGLIAEGFEAEMEHLKDLKHPAILHVVINDALLHFVVCYGYDEKTDLFEISDPGEIKLKYYSTSELNNIWQSKTLLLIKPGPDILQMPRSDTFISKMKWLFDFARPDFDLLFVSFILGLFVAMLGLSVAVFSQKLIDIILPAKDYSKLWLGSGLLLFLLVLRIGFSYLRQIFLLRQTKIFNVRILSFFYSSLLKLPKPFFDSRKTGELIARMNDTSRIQQTVTNIFTHLTIEIVIVIITTASLFFYHFHLGLLSLLWLPVFGWIVYYFNNGLIEGQRKVMVSYARNESNYIDTIQGIGAIKLATKEALYADKTKTIYQDFQEQRFQLGLLGNRFGTLAQIAGAVFTIGIILYSSDLVIHEIISIGSVMAIIQMIGMSMASASSIAGININLQEAKVAIDRMQEFTLLPAEYNETEDLQKTKFSDLKKLEVKELNFRFIGRSILLNNISFKLEKGEIIAILGESGGGKSTLLQILQQFYIQESGDLNINDTAIHSFSLTEWRKNISVVPQQIKLFNGTLFENILMKIPEERDIEPLIQFFETYQFNQYFEKFPYGYNTILGESGVNISGGQMQIVALARALYNKPQLLLLDEATSAMDRYTEQKILNLLLSIKSDLCTILVTHRPPIAALADRIYILENGNIKHFGTPYELSKYKNLFSDTNL